LATGDVQQRPSPEEWPVRAASAIAATTARRARPRRRTSRSAFGRKRDSNDAAAVLVRDAALAPVPDRLDDRHADVAGLLLDRVDHGLDPLPHDHRLDLDHRAPPGP
jgi:hypothetical protein